MRFNNLKINGFGKLKGKELNLNDGINIIYGENEAGKSTLLKFISSMLYGASKTKNGKNISDFDKYKPWKTEEFSGKIDYTLDNGERFEVYREFKKKNPIIYNEYKEDISKTFKENKTKGIDFFTEQTGIDEETYYNTAVIEQANVKLEKSSQNAIIQKISNLMSSGDDNISFQKTITQINKLQAEKVGTNRTQNRPINMVNEDIEYLEKKINELELNEIQKTSNGKTIEELKVCLEKEENKHKFLEELKVLLENNRLKYAEVNFSRNLEQENFTKLEELRAKLEKVEEEDISKKENMLQYYIVFGILVVLGVILLIFLPSKIWGIVSIIGAIVEIINIIFRKNMAKKKFEKEKLDAKTDIVKEMNIIKRNNEEVSTTIHEKIEKINLEEKNKKKVLVENYAGRISDSDIEKFLDAEYEDIIAEIGKVAEQEIKYNTSIAQAKINKDAIAEKEQEMANLVEKLAYAKEEKEELLSLNNSYNIARECLERAYENVKRNISPTFTNNLCKIISKISNEKYKVLKFDDEKGLIVELDNGNYVPAERLSVGTIDQMYLSLRLSSSKEISNEKMPIILDEVFAYFDNNRLSNILRYLNEEYKDNQIVIFTCSNREKEILNELNIEYNLINLEK